MKNANGKVVPAGKNAIMQTRPSRQSAAILNLLRTISLRDAKRLTLRIRLRPAGEQAGGCRYAKGVKAEIVAGWKKNPGLTNQTLMLK